MRLDIKRIKAAVRNIDPVFLNSPQYVCEGLSRALGCRIVLKVETLKCRVELFQGPRSRPFWPGSDPGEARTKWSARARGTLAKPSLIAAG